jgi:hypothetical protein
MRFWLHGQIYRVMLFKRSLIYFKAVAVSRVEYVLELDFRCLSGYVSNLHDLDLRSVFLQTYKAHERSREAIELAYEAILKQDMKRRQKYGFKPPKLGRKTDLEADVVCDLRPSLSMIQRQPPDNHGQALLCFVTGCMMRS